MLRNQVKVRMMNDSVDHWNGDIIIDEVRHRLDCLTERQGEIEGGLYDFRSRLLDYWAQKSGGLERPPLVTTSSLTINQIPPD